jgi:protein TonB
MAQESEDDDLYLRPAEKRPPDDASWDVSEARPESRGPEFDPLDEPVGPPPAEPVGKPFLLRAALSVAALIALVLVAREFWWPEPDNFPEAAPAWAAAPHVPVPAEPGPVVEEEAPPPEVTEEPAAVAEVLEDDYEILQTEELAREPSVPRPVEPPRPRQEPQIAAAPPPAPEPAVVEETRVVEEPARPEPQPAAPTPRRPLSPAPWETASQPSGLLRPGPGVEEPVPLDLPRYRYPPAAQGTGLSVGVRLALLVDERGRVIDAVVREGGPEDLGFAEEALKVAKQIPFQPASRYDIPGKMWTEMILEFEER